MNLQTYYLKLSSYSTILILSLLVIGYQREVRARNLTLRSPNAYADQGKLATTWLQQAIDSVSATGAGQLTIQQGVYLTGGLVIKSGVRLYLNKGVVLLGSTNLADYEDHIPAYPNNMNQQSQKALLYAEGASRIAVLGKGILDGQGEHINFKFRGNQYNNRPFLIRFVDCKEVLVKGIKLTKAANWTQQYQHCDQVKIIGITVDCFSNRNNDGLDIDASSNVLVEGCTIHADDDAICLKSSSKDPCVNVTVRNCVISSNCNAIKLGTASIGGFKRIKISNIKILPPLTPSHIWMRQYGLAGIALEIVDGGIMDDVVVENIRMEQVMTPIFLRLGDRGKGLIGDPPRPIGSMQNVKIRHIKAHNLLRPVSSCIMGIPNGIIKNILLEDINIEGPGGVLAQDVRDTVPELAKGYPENKMFGNGMPSSLLYIKHAEGITIKRFKGTLVKPDARPAIGFEDVNQATLSDITAPAFGQWIKARNSANISIKGGKVIGQANPLTINDNSTNLLIEGVEVK